MLSCRSRSVIYNFKNLSSLARITEDLEVQNTRYKSLNHELKGSLSILSNNIDDIESATAELRTIYTKYERQVREANSAPVFAC
jgi:chromosome segregation ATPase